VKVNNLFLFRAQKKKKKNPAVKYTAAELQRKKILLEIDGLESER